MLDKTLATSFQDLGDDFSELHFLFSSIIKKIEASLKEFEKKKRFINPEVFDDTTTKLQDVKNSLYALLDEVNQCEILARQGSSQRDLELFIQKKQSLSMQFRSHQLFVSSLILATDWQSPTFAHSKESLAGRQTSLIKATVNDYKRDFHQDEVQYESLFLKEYVDTLMKSVLYSYSVNSGMAALSTILSFLAAEGKQISSVFLGRSSYFENKELIHAAFRDHVLEVDETDTEKLCALIKEKKPEIIFLDTLCNSSTITLPDTKAILTYIEKNISHDMTIILDNTGLAFFLQPLTRSLLINRHIRLIVFESLNKYYQFGMDRVTGGFIWAHGKNAGKLFLAREHSGTNITDMSVLTLPHPSRKYLERRMLRLGRNAFFLAKELEKWIMQYKGSPFSQIYYPKLSSHPSFQWATREKFSGSYFSFGFKKTYQEVKLYQSFIKKVMDKAQKEKIQLVSGTSFGMNTSRIYLTALRSDVTDPFIRFSVGTETQYEIEKIAAILKEAMQEL